MSRSSKKFSMIQFIDFELMLLQDYLHYVEEYFALKEIEIDTKFAELNSTPDDDPIRKQLENYHQSYFEVLLDGLVDESFYKQEFTQRFRYSLVIQIHSFLEKYLTKIRDHFKKKNGTKKVTGNYIEKIQQIISQVDISSYLNYNFIVCFTELRNSIVHDEGIIYSNSSNINRLKALKELEKKKLITLKETKTPTRIRYEVIINDKSFLEKSVDKIEIFLKEIDKALKDYY